MRTRYFSRVMLLACPCAVLLACGGQEGGEQAEPAATVPVATSTASTQTPDAGRIIIPVDMTTEADGSYFSPRTFEAQRGDVIRFTLVQGVHNVHFLADSNPGKRDLPPASAMLQLPGQTYDVKVTFAPGTYYFQCDPHIGMTGRVTVTQ